MEKTSTAPITVAAILDRWPSRVAVAEDAAVSVARVHKWAPSNSIPAKYHLSLLEGAARRGIALTAEELVRAHAGPRDGRASAAGALVPQIEPPSEDAA